MWASSFKCSENDTTAFVELSVTTSIPDSWELPSYLAGDLVPMNRYRDRGVRESEPVDWAEGEGADVVSHPKWNIRRGPVTQKSEPKPIRMAPGQVDIEPYDPKKHLPPAELYDQDSLDALERSGFQPAEDGVWHRPVTTDEGEHLGASHIIVYEPGHRRPSDGSRAPWHLMTDPETAGIAFRTLHGPQGALSAADEDVAQARKMPKQARLYLSVVATFVGKTAAAQSPGRANADDWLASNPEESFEHDPREEARRWMDEHAHQYDQWHPSASDYTYPDFTDVAGQSFRGDEAQSHVMPGSAYDFGHQPTTRQDSYTEDEESGDQPSHERDLADLGFNWQHRGDPNTTPVGEYQEGEYVRHQHNPEGQHVATHIIRRVPYTNTWHVESTDPSDSNFAYESSEHRFPADAISRYHDNSERALLPTRGYEPHRGRSGAITHWTRTDTDPHSGRQYEHEISNQPLNGEGNDQGWLGHTVSEGMTAPSHGTGPLHRYDLADVVREHDRTGRGLHPGGSQDYRLTRSELLADPSVARLGGPFSISDDFYGDGRVGAARWHWPHPEGNHLPGVNAEATYNWDKGGYDFKYAHDGVPLAVSHNSVPAGAPVHIPGRQTRLGF